ncbi:type IV secretion system protein [Bartonella sp. B23]
MKKVTIAMALVITLGTTNLVKAWIWGAGAADLNATVPTDWPKLSFGSSKKPPKKPSTPQHYVELINLIKQQLEMNKKQLAKAEETYKSITGNRKSDTRNVDYHDFFLKNPKSIYNKEKHSEILAALTDMQKKENLIGSASNVRKSIEERILYTTAVNKNISSKAFDNTEARLNHILSLLSKIDKTNDLKSTSDLHVRIKSILAMIQNEAVNLQMIAHLRSTEQELIKQQKDRHSIRILNSKNTDMPSIRFIR